MDRFVIGYRKACSKGKMPLLITLNMRLFRILAPCFEWVEFYTVRRRSLPLQLSFHTKKYLWITTCFLWYDKMLRMKWWMCMIRIDQEQFTLHNLWSPPLVNDSISKKSLTLCAVHEHVCVKIVSLLLCSPLFCLAWQCLHGLWVHWTTLKVRYRSNQKQNGRRSWTCHGDY